jgi:subtilisin family serine protease
VLGIEDLTRQPRFGRQWHLHKPNKLLGINAVGAWTLTRGSKEIKVVVFDTGVDLIHPNLHPNLVLEEARDFDHSLEEEVKLEDSEIEELLQNAVAADYAHRARARKEEQAASRKANSLGPAQTSKSGLGFDRVKTNARIYNPHDAHGTASAGIVAAAANDTGCVGVAPECSIVPVRISTNVEFKSLIAAVKYASQVGQVILMPRSLPWVEAQPSTPGGAGASAAKHAALSPVESKASAGEHPSLRHAVDTQAHQTWLELNGKDGREFWRALDGKSEQELSAILYAAISEVAERVPVVCASGNNGTGSLIYPACLEATIAVGACNEKGWRSTYSQYGRGLDLVAPSNDVPTRSETLTRCSEDMLGPDERPEDFGVERLGMFGIDTTDNLGPFGYNPDPPGDYCEADGDFAFGGTSAAAAQVAGVVALMLSANRALTPSDIREILRDKSSMDHLHGEPKAGPTGEAPTKEEFGSGLIDAAKAVQAAADTASAMKPARPAAQMHSTAA